MASLRRKAEPLAGQAAEIEALTSCVTPGRNLAPVDEPWSDGRLAVVARAGPELRFVTARRPLRVASVADLTVPDGNDLTAVRVHYPDSDGRDADTQSPVDFYQMSVRDCPTRRRP
jgi:hypothetical protein